MQVRDHYFAAWAIARGVKANVIEGKVYLDIDAAKMRELTREYRQTEKPLFDRVKAIVKQINATRPV